jgi:hypothetical protein
MARAVWSDRERQSGPRTCHSCPIVYVGVQTPVQTSDKKHGYLQVRLIPVGIRLGLDRRTRPRIRMRAGRAPRAIVAARSVRRLGLARRVGSRLHVWKVLAECSGVRTIWRTVHPMGPDGLQGAGVAARRAIRLFGTGTSNIFGPLDQRCCVAELAGDERELHSLPGLSLSKTGRAALDRWERFCVPCVESASAIRSSAQSSNCSTGSEGRARRSRVRS